MESREANGLTARKTLDFMRVTWKQAGSNGWDCREPVVLVHAVLLAGRHPSQARRGCARIATAPRAFCRGLMSGGVALMTACRAAGHALQVRLSSAWVVPGRGDAW